MSPYYSHAGITIYHGDCRDILPQLEPVDLVLTDPPYPNYNADRGISPGRAEAEREAEMSAFVMVAIYSFGFLARGISEGDWTPTALLWVGMFVVGCYMGRLK